MPSSRTRFVSWFLALQQWRSNSSRQQTQLYGLYRLLGSFPSLVELRLEGAEFNSVLQAEERIALSPTSPGFLLHHAPLGSLVFALLETPILRLVWFAEPETYRWTRSSREENFVAERYK